MTDPETAVQNIADSAKSTLKEAVGILEAASDAVDETGTAHYDKHDLLATLTQLTSVSMLGGLKVVEAALANRPRRPSEGLLVLADHLASITERTLHQARGVVEQAAHDIGGDPRTAQPWVDAATKLADIAVVNGIETVQTVAIGPARYAPRNFVSDPFAVAGLEPGELEAGTDFARPGDRTVIPRDAITFSPPELGVDHKEYRVLVDETGLPSGVYIGTVTSKGGGEQKIALRL